MYRFEILNGEKRDFIGKWKYESEFSCYDLDDKMTDIDDLLDKEEYDFFVAMNQGDEIIGFMDCCFKNETLEVSHGLNPNLTGQGLGYDFISESIEFAVEYYDYAGDSITIHVEPFNVRAIKVYKRAGFIIVNETVEFVEMELFL